MSFQIDNENESNRKANFIAEINMTPFVDVCLVLLIIFMVTAPFAISGVNVQLPKTSQSKSLSLSNESLILSINKKGEFYIGKEFIKDTSLVTVIKNSIKDREHPSIFIRADDGVPYGKVMAAMTAAQKAGIERIGMVGENKRDKK
ncbi:protein TolR [Silvanigrella paludirubra]|jgi:biopolymer transport protein TolR|uniref:Protein TolR n=1 Tax=Silvanigrella paludirubra TaxID=2499159 RepID=A0A6N6VRT8_9BACT|nr:ExbD/TolR family protein [Silvanigrella paludirubra]KAB8038832.1 protein TolR [Silvanigrella paludirubra]